MQNILSFPHSLPLQRILYVSQDQTEEKSILFITKLDFTLWGLPAPFFKKFLFVPPNPHLVPHSPIWGLSGTAGFLKKKGP